METGSRALLIGAGLGPQSALAEPGNSHGTAHGSELLNNLAELGRKPEEIEATAFTHLQLDHLGRAWHPALPGVATILLSPGPTTSSLSPSDLNTKPPARKCSP